MFRFQRIFLLLALINISLISPTSFFGSVGNTSLDSHRNNFRLQTTDPLVTSMDWGANNKIAVGYNTGTLKVFSATGQLLNTFTLPNIIISVTWHPQQTDNRIVIGSSEGFVWIFDTATSQILKTLQSPTSFGRMTTAIWSPDGNRVAAPIIFGGTGAENVVAIWDATSGNLLKSLKGDSEIISSIAWRPSGSDHLAGGFSDGKVIVWDVTTGTAIQTLQMQGSDNVIHAVIWSPNGNQLAAADLKIQIWNTSTYQSVNVFPLSEVAVDLAWSSDGSRIAVIANHELRVLDAVSGTLLSSVPTEGFFAAVAWSPDNSKVVYGGESIGTTDNVVIASAPSTSTLKLQYYPDPTARGATVDAIIPDFNIVNTGSTAVPLSELKLRYYFTRDSAPQTILFNCDFTELPGGCASITGQVVTLSTPVTGADSYIEVGFTSGTLAANSQTQDILVDVVKLDMSEFTQTNDYSFDDRDPSFTDWTKVTLYRNGTLVWGTPPS